MPEYRIQFAGRHVAIQYENDEVYDFLTLLFQDVQSALPGDYEKIIVISQEGDTGKYSLVVSDKVQFHGILGVHCAAVLFDAVIFNLLNRNSDGVALHAGAVVYRDKAIVLPGTSGSGKSTISAWLTAHDCSYLTDELIFFPASDSGQTIPFTRPFCIKSGAVPEVKKIIRAGNLHDILEDELGAVVPHRSINPEFSRIISPPSLLLFPVFQPASSLKVEKVSGAQGSNLLMACDVNARNLPDHGFKQIVQIARSTPAYQLTYGSFLGLEDALGDLFATLNWV